MVDIKLACSDSYVCINIRKGLLSISYQQQTVQINAQKEPKNVEICFSSH